MTDKDTAKLTLQLALHSINETAGPAATTAIFTRNTDTTNPLTVKLISGRTDKVGVPARVIKQRQAVS